MVALDESANPLPRALEVTSRFSSAHLLSGDDFDDREVRVVATHDHSSLTAHASHVATD